MKNFKEFLEFMESDWAVELNELKREIGDSIHSELLDVMALDEEPLDALLELTITTAMKHIIFALHRYHEWHHATSDSSAKTPDD